MTHKEALVIPPVNFDENGELIISAAPHSSKHDFDFFIGKWSLINRKLVSRLSGCTDWIEFESTQEMHTVLNGIGNIDNFLTTLNGEPYEGMTVRLFNPSTKLWSIYWADSDTGKFNPPVVGSFENNVGHFFSKDYFNRMNIVVVFRWDARDKDNPAWSQAFSADYGKTWEWNWFMFMTKLV